MNYPSIKTLETRLNISRIDAKIVRGLMKGDIEPETIEDTDNWVRSCFNRPSEDELIMNAINNVLCSFGVEAMGHDIGGFYRHTGFGLPVHHRVPQYSYCNSGDTYTCTVILDNETGRFIVSDIGTLIESGKVTD